MKKEAETSHRAKWRGSASSCRSTEGGKPFVQGTGVQLPVQVKGGSLAQGDLLPATNHIG